MSEIYNRISGSGEIHFYCSQKESINSKLPPFPPFKKNCQFWTPVSYV